MRRREREMEGKTGQIRRKMTSWRNRRRKG
jgi:hypothetical protein